MEAHSLANVNESEWQATAGCGQGLHSNDSFLVYTTYTSTFQHQWCAPIRAGFMTVS